MKFSVFQISRKGGRDKNEDRMGYCYTRESGLFVLADGMGGHPEGMNAMTKGCLAGTGVCFISHEGEVYPCGYLPAIAGDLRRQSFSDIWENSQVFAQLRDSDNLKGKCGCCEFRNICMGCRARAYGYTQNYLAEEPNCDYTPLRMRRRES